MAHVRKLSIAVLASGRGSNLQALIDARDEGVLPVEFALVASDKAEAAALRRAEAAGITSLALEPTGFATRADFDRALFARVDESGAQLVVLAGFMRILDADAIAPWQGRMINIHPSLLPKYRGLHTHRRALQAGDSEHGSSVHFVSAELDGGPLIAQARLPVRSGDDETSLANRLLPLEHRLLVAVVAAIARGQIGCDESRATFNGRPLSRPLCLDAEGFGLHSVATGHARAP